MAAVDVEVTPEGVATVVLNRPEAANAVDGTTGRLLGETLDELEATETVRSIILTGAGDRYFCCGMDLKAFAAGDTKGIFSSAHGFAGITQRRFRCVTIAAVNGLALGGGFEIVLSCDLAVCCPGAEFGLPEIKHGLIAGAGGLVHLPVAVPPKVAAQIALVGGRVDAELAQRFGLVNEVVAPEQLRARCVELARSVAAHSEAAVAATREMLASVPRLSEEAAWSLNRELSRRVVSQLDRSGVRVRSDG